MKKKTRNLDQGGKMTGTKRNKRKRTMEERGKEGGKVEYEVGGSGREGD